MSAFFIDQISAPLRGAARPGKAGAFSTLRIAARCCAPRRGFRPVLLIPRDRFREAGGERCLRREAEALARARHVEPAPRLAVRLRRIPYELAGESGRARDRGREVRDRDLL